MEIKRNRLGQFVQGMPFHTKETKKKMVQSHMGIGKGIPLSEKHRKSISDGMKKATIHMRDKKDCPDSIYQSAHKWMQRWYGKPQKCEKCGRTKPPKGKGKKDYFHWANKDGKYSKNPKDWIRLCAICHRNYDFKRTK